MTSFAYKFVASFLVAITFSMSSVCPCAMASQDVAAQNAQVMPCCGNEAPNKTPAGNHDNSACKRCCSARASETTKPTQFEAPAPQFTFFTFPPVLMAVQPTLISAPNARYSFVSFPHVSSSLLRLHCALLI
jgi:hypothetical protein